MAMNCTRCSQPITKGQPYARTKRGAHHFKQENCKLPEQFDAGLREQRDYYIARLGLAENKLKEFDQVWERDKYVFKRSGETP